MALAAVVIESRMVQWPLGVRFAVVSPITGLPLSIAWLAELEHESPRAYHSVLLVAALLPLTLIVGFGLIAYAAIDRERGPG